MKKAARSTLVHVLTDILLVLHPFMPFVTEEIYQALPHACQSINLETWPKPVKVDINENEMADIKQLLSMISAVREIKKDYNLKPSAPISIVIKDENNALKQGSKQLQAILEFMCHATWEPEDNEEEKVVRPIHNGTLSVALAQIVNVEEEMKKLTAQLEKLTAEIKRCEGMLANPNFVNKAPEAKVNAEKEKLEYYKKQYETVEKQLEALKSK